MYAPRMSRIATKNDVGAAVRVLTVRGLFGLAAMAGFVALCILAR